MAVFLKDCALLRPDPAMCLCSCMPTLRWRGQCYFRKEVRTPCQHRIYIFFLQVNINSDIGQCISARMVRRKKEKKRQVFPTDSNRSF